MGSASSSTVDSQGITTDIADSIQEVLNEDTNTQRIDQELNIKNVKNAIIENINMEAKAEMIFKNLHKLNYTETFFNDVSSAAASKITDKLGGVGANINFNSVKNLVKNEISNKQIYKNTQKFLESQDITNIINLIDTQNIILKNVNLTARLKSLKNSIVSDLDGANVGQKVMNSLDLTNTMENKGALSFLDTFASSIQNVVIVFIVGIIVLFLAIFLS